MFRIRTIVVATLALAAAAPPVLACGGYSQRTAGARRPTSAQARGVVSAHFAALAKGDARTVRALWSPRALIEAGGRKQSLDQALPRWLAHRQGLRWTIERVDPLFSGGFQVAVTVHWNGGTYDDVLVVEHDGDAVRIVSKLSTVRAGSASQRPYG